MRNNKILIWKLISLLLILLPASLVHAESSSSGVVGYSVGVTIPSSQENKDSGFFDLKMKSNQKETLEAVIYNSSDKPIKVKHEIHTAYTNEKGSIEYVKEAKDYDRTLKYRMSEITKVDGDSTVTIPANSSKKVHALVNMPEVGDFKGVILGGWYFERIDKDGQTDEKKQNIQITNRYSYVLGVKFTVQEKVPAHLTMNKVDVGMANYHRSVLVNLQNTESVIIPHLQVNISVTRVGEKKPMLEHVSKNLQMAPNSNFDYSIPYGANELKPGDYEMKLTANSGENKWLFNKKFTVSEEKAKKYNKLSVDTPNKSKEINPLLYILFGVLIVLLTLGIIYLIRVCINKKK